jgi:tetratricopeptide (TPR) repeat protein
MDFDKLWNHADPAATERRFRELLPAAGSPDYRLQLLTQIARTLGLQRKFDEAHRLLDTVEKEMTPDLKTVRVRYLLERGRTFRSGKQAEKSRPLFLAAWELGREAGLDAYAVDAAHMMAMVEPGAGWNEKAMALAEASREEEARRWLGSLYNNIGWDLHAAGRYEEALAVHLKCRDWYAANAPESQGAFISRWSVARQLRALKRTEEALAIQRALLGENGKDGFVQEEIAECLHALGREEEAKPYFRRAHEMLKGIDWVAEDKARLERLARLGG